jgi:uncharacterized circularly permuted ATP-grasp superfamily protein
MAASPETIVEGGIAGLEALVASYRPLPDIFDEMMDAGGGVRPHWRPLLDMLAALGPEDINRRFAAADRYLRSSGVFYRVYEDAAGIERPWPLSHVPLIIDPTEWRALETGLVQRAELLEAVLADAYGASLLTRDGHLPATVLAGNPEFLRPLVGVVPPGGAHLRFYAVDVTRGADGRWWVLGDRAQAPSGAGYAIENRLALSRAVPDIYRASRAERLAPFFQAFQAELASLGRRDDAHICVLTPGPISETYFEHAYLARYLGFLMVESEDLSVRDDGVFVRTVSGLQRTEVLLRRIDADFADPLELNAASRLGAPGLLQAVRNGKVVMVNALGAGLVEARAMLAFLPALRRLSSHMSTNARKAACSAPSSTTPQRRAEATLRLVRAMTNRAAEADETTAPMLAALGGLLQAWNAVPDGAGGAQPAFLMRAALTNAQLSGALPALTGASRAAASGIRDRFSPDAWRAIHDLATLIAMPLASGANESAITERVEAALRIISSLSGLVQENMTRLAGWRFLELGRRIERAILTGRLIRCFALGGATEGGLELMLNSPTARSPTGSAMSWSRRQRR